MEGGIGFGLGSVLKGSPLVFAPPALALLPAITDDCVPVAVRLFLIFGRYLEREGLRYA